MMLDKILAVNYIDEKLLGGDWWQ